MRIEHIVPVLERPPVAAAPAMAKKLTRPPALSLLPRRRAGAGVMLASVGLHTLAMAALIWLPRLFPSPIFLPVEPIKPAASADFEPLVAPNLPQLEARGSGSAQPAASKPGVGSGVARPAADPPPQKPDYTAPQEIISFFPNAVNRVQTIRRPDLVAPPEMKFPTRLQSMVVLPSSPVPVLNAPPREEPKPVSLPVTRQEIPLDEAIMQNPALTLTPKRLLPVPEETAPPQAASPSPEALAKPQASPPKAVVVVNAVAVPPDPMATIPDAQLAGNFVVGPSPASSVTEKSAVAGAGRSSEGSSGKTEEGSSGAGLNSDKAAGSDSGHAAGGGGGNRASASAGAGSGTVGGHGSATGPSSGSGVATGVGGKPGIGDGTGTGSARGLGAGSGGSGHGAGNGPSTGISISGGVPGRNGAAITPAVPVHRSYSLMIISGGSSGGASRDVGVFDRSETVYSVTIPMADAGGGPDWTMQYALLNRVQTGASLLVPPFVQKKVAATMAKSQIVGESGPIFISGTIDESGKLQSLRAIRAQDVRSQPAIRALEQWEFLPAQLDGRPVASKVLIGVTMTMAN